MPVIVALDVATRTGVAIGEPCGSPVAYSVQFEKDDDKRLAGILNLTRRLITEHDPKIIAIEAPIGGERSNHLLIGMVACIRAECTLHGVQPQMVAISTARKHFISRHISTTQFKHIANKRRRQTVARDEAKAAVMTRCRMLGWRHDDEDACDAMAVWDYSCSTLSRTHQIATLGGLFDGDGND